MDQVVDLEGSPQFQALDVQLVSISTDSVPELAQAIRQWDVRAPHLSDRDGEISRRYGVLKWAMPNGEPGHTFVLVGKDRGVQWIRDYGAPENGGHMYVPTETLYQELIRHVPPRQQPTPSPVERGAVLYEANCQDCHGGATGGSMMDIPPPHNANGHTWHHPDCQLVEAVLNGSGPMGEMMRQMMGVPADVPRMPAFAGTLTEEEVRAILAHIKAWWTEEQRRVQARLTKQAC